MDNYPCGARFDKSAPYNQPITETLYEENDFKTTLTRTAEMEWKDDEDKPDKDIYFERNNLSVTELLKMYLDLLNETGCKDTFLKDEIKAWLDHDDEEVYSI